MALLAMMHSATALSSLGVVHATMFYYILAHNAGPSWWGVILGGAWSECSEGRMQVRNESLTFSKIS